MIQYPNEKEPHSDWVNPTESQRGAPSFSQNPPYSPPPGPFGHSGSYATLPQAHAQNYMSPQSPPPRYSYDQNQDRSAYDSDAKSPVIPYNAYGAPGSPLRAAPSAFLPSSSSMQDGNSDGTMSLGSFFGSQGTPLMWQRPAPPQLPYSAFPPMCLLSNTKDLTDGFPLVPPPCTLDLHPFATHDVTEVDWKRFLEDVKKAAKLSTSQRIKSNVIPLVTGMSFLTGFMATSAIEKRMKNKNRRAASDLVDNWNYYFFGPRRMEVALCQGSERLSGEMGAAPFGDPNYRRSHHRRSSSSSSSSDEGHGRIHRRRSFSSSSSDEGHGRKRYGRNSDKQARRAARRERREEKRERKRERRERKARGENELPYQLVVSPI